MKRLSMVLAIAMVLIMAIAGLAYAEQAKFIDNGHVYYNSTTATAASTVYESGSLARLKAANQFNADNSSKYPYEIYLPNEIDPGNYRTHSNYSKNTDACASCHATHTAVGSSLLQWFNAFDACMACHDGTVTTTYNVEEGFIGPSSVGRSTYGGMFGLGREDSLSNHNVTGGLAIAAAPGGSTTANAVKVGSHNETQWVNEFGCESCHTPHGQGGNARILNPDPNFAQTAAASATGYNTSTKDGSAYVVAAPAEKAVASGYYYFINGYPYSISVYNLDDNSKLTANTQYSLDSSAGYTKITLIGLDPTAGIRVYGTPAMTVTMDIDNYLTSTEAVKHLSGMNNFCGACHTDYNTQTAANYSAGKFSGSGEKLTGTYSEAYRHQVGFTTSAAAGLVTEGGKMECLTCHVAHGTSKDYWQRTLVDAAIKGPDGTTWATGDLAEIAGSSALKRMPNMGTCEACHKKEVGNQGYAVNSGTNSDQTSATSDYSNYNSVSYFAYSGDWSYKPTGTYRQFNALLNPDGTGFFKDEKYVGSAACSTCHKEYYEGWESRGHSKSFESVNDISWYADQFTRFNGQSFTRQDHIESGSSAGQLGASYTYSFTDNKLTYTVGSSTYQFGVNDINYIWMDHYVLQTVDASKGIYKRVAVVDEEADGITAPKLKPYLGRSTGTPTTPSNVSWYANATGTGNPADGCLSCHSPKSVNENVGGNTSLAGVAQGTPDQTIGCEACHGPASRHVKSPSSANIFNPKTRLDFGQRVNFCESCHSGNHEVIQNAPVSIVSTNTLSFRDSSHFISGLAGCTDCHNVHNLIKDKDGNHQSLKAPSEQQLCASCHDQVLALEDMQGTNNFEKHGFKD